MTLSQLVYVVTVAEKKSMNKAAAELFVSQPALSGAIRDLEEEIHTQIFLRSNKGIVVTAEGEEFLSYARQIVQINQMINERYTEDKSQKKSKDKIKKWSGKNDRHPGIYRFFAKRFFTIQCFLFSQHHTGAPKGKDFPRIYRIIIIFRMFFKKTAAL